MTHSEQDQEYVLGTKQLLSAFFVVVVLLGVFFTAGYVIGRNTGPKSSVAASDASANASPSAEAAQRTASRTADPVPEHVTDPPPAQRDPPRTTPVTAATSEPSRPTVTPAAQTKPPTTPEEVGAVSSQVTPGHLYLQLMAVKRPVADNMVKLLKGRGYQALLGESSKPELFRVLVGPFSDMASLAKTKTNLKAAGFESVVAK